MIKGFLAACSGTGIYLQQAAKLSNNLGLSQGAEKSLAAGSHMARTDDISERIIAFGQGLAAIPERLLLAHARGQVLFIAGSGVSKSAELPDFRDLVLRVYKQLDAAVFAVISTIPRSACNLWGVDLSELAIRQAAEVRRFITGDFDVVLGMLERRVDNQSSGRSRVRQAIGVELRLSLSQITS